MAHAWGRSCWRLELTGTLAIAACLSTDLVLAQSVPPDQLVPDATLGVESSTVVPGVDIGGLLSDRIEGGAQRGANLFHSFSLFNVPTGSSAYFANPLGVQNIITRVTGNTPSFIDGRLGVLGGANLYLLNPSGMIFGPNASLDIPGSFVASTASSIQLGAGQFSATEPDSSMLLDVQPGALFLTALAQQSGIINQATLTSGGNLSLVANNVSSDGALLAPNGAVLVEGRSGNVSLQLVDAQSAEVRAGNSLVLSGSQLTTVGDLSLVAGSQLVLSDSATTPFNAGVGGNLLVQGGEGVNIQMTNPTSLLQSGGSLGVNSSRGAVLATANFVSGADLSMTAATSLGLGSSQLNAVGAIEILSTGGGVQIQDSLTSPTIINAGAQLQIAGAQGVTLAAQNNPASLLQSAGDLSLRSSSGDVIANALLQAGGGLTIAAGRDTTLSGYVGPSFNLSTTGNLTIMGAIDTSSAIGNGGSVSLAAGRNLSVAGAINTSAIAGYGGSVALSADGTLSTAGINTSSVSGNAGSISLTSQAGVVDTRRGELNATSEAGNGGAVSISGAGGVFTGWVDSYSINGLGGSIRLSSSQGNIDASSGGLQSFSFSNNGGDVQLAAAGDILTSYVDSSSENGRGGSLGFLSLNGRINTSIGDGILYSYTYDQNGGDVTLTASGDITTGTIVSESLYASAGDIAITSLNGSIDTTRGDLLAWVGTLDPRGGSGGNVTLRAANNIQVSTIRSDGGLLGASGDIQLLSGGDIRLTPNPNSLFNELNSSTYGVGRGGNILVQAGQNGTVSIAGIRLSSTVEAAVNGVPVTGSGGDIRISGEFVSLDRAVLDTQTLSAGNGGNVWINATNQVSILNGSLINTTVAAGATGTGGSIQIYGTNVTLDGRSGVSSGTQGQGNSGAITIATFPGGTVTLDNRSSIASDTSSIGLGGNILINTDNLSLLNNASINARTLDVGNGGSITMNVAGSVALDSSLVSTSVGNLGATGRGGDITVVSGSVQLTNGARFESRTQGPGAAGNIWVTTPGEIFLSGANAQGNNSGFLASSDGDLSGAGGNIVVTADRLNLADGAFFSARTQSSSRGGNILANVNFLTLLGGGQMITSSSGIGSAGSIDLNAAQGLIISGFNPNFVPNSENPNENGLSGLFAQTAGSGRAGSLTVNTPALLVQDLAQVSVATTGSGDGGALTINTNQFWVRNGAEVSASSSGSGTGGLMQINATRFINLSSGGSLSARSTGAGTAGSLQLNTNQLLMNNGQASVSSSQSGDAGNLEVFARSVFLLNNSSLTAETAAGGGGNIRLQVLERLALSGSWISASTENGQGGELSLVVGRSVDLLNGSGLFAQATQANGTGGNLSLVTRGNITLQTGSEISTSTAGLGNAGEIEIRGNSLFISGGSRITSRSGTNPDFPSLSATTTSGGGNAGRIDLVLANLLRLDRGEISASSERGGGGSIFISARDIKFTNSSLVSTRVLSGEGEGGNIDILASKIFMALGDSDILANAEDGKGGIIEIKSPIFIADLYANVGPNPGRDFSRFRGNGQVDISASSRFGISGVVSIPDFSFLQRSLTNLSEKFVKTEQVVAGSCLSRRNMEQGKFIAVGTGGLPDDPYNLIRRRYELIGVQPTSEVALPESTPMAAKTPQPEKPIWQPGMPIQEAQGIMKTQDGQVLLGTNNQLATIAQIDELICHSEPAEVSFIPQTTH